MLEKLDNCPVCSSPQSTVFVTCKDYTVSGEAFSIVQCRDCNFKYTNPRPTEESSGVYYQSESYVSHSETKKGLVNKLYHIIRERALAGKLTLVNSLHTKGKLLDVGCGTGDFLRVCKQDGWQVKGIEVDARARSKASVNSGSEIQPALLEAYENEKFDVITLWHVLEHIHQLHESIEKINVLLEKGGVVLIAVPNSDSWDAQNYKQYWAAYDVPRHLYHFNQLTLAQLLAKHGLKIARTEPMKYDAFYISMLSSKYRSGSTHYLEALKNGFLSNLRAAREQNNYSSLIYIITR